MTKSQLVGIGKTRFFDLLDVRATLVIETNEKVV